jgi:hypothetical protein
MFYLFNVLFIWCSYVVCCSIYLMFYLFNVLFMVTNNASSHHQIFQNVKISTENMHKNFFEKFDENLLYILWVFFISILF